MTKNRTPTPVYLDPGMHSGLEVKGLRDRCNTLQTVQSVGETMNDVHYHDYDEGGVISSGGRVTAKILYNVQHL